MTYNFNLINIVKKKKRTKRYIYFFSIKAKTVEHLDLGKPR